MFKPLAFFLTTFATTDAALRCSTKAVPTPAPSLFPDAPKGDDALANEFSLPGDAHDYGAYGAYPSTAPSSFSEFNALQAPAGDHVMSTSVVNENTVEGGDHSFPAPIPTSFAEFIAEQAPNGDDVMNTVLEPKDEAVPSFQNAPQPCADQENRAEPGLQDQSQVLNTDFDDYKVEQVDLYHPAPIPSSFSDPIDEQSLNADEVMSYTKEELSPSLKNAPQPCVNPEKEAVSPSDETEVEDELMMKSGSIGNEMDYDNVDQTLDEQEILLENIEGDSVYEEELPTPMPSVFDEELPAPMPSVFDEELPAPMPSVFEEELPAPMPSMFNEEIPTTASPAPDSLKNPRAQESVYYRVRNDLPGPKQGYYLGSNGKGLKLEPTYTDWKFIFNSMDTSKGATIQLKDQDKSHNYVIAAKGKRRAFLREYDGSEFQLIETGIADQYYIQVKSGQGSGQYLSQINKGVKLCGTPTPWTLIATPASST